MLQKHVEVMQYITMSNTPYSFIVLAAGPIVGIVFGVIGGLIFFGIFISLICRRQNRTVTQHRTVNVPMGNAHQTYTTPVVISTHQPYPGHAYPTQQPQGPYPGYAVAGAPPTYAAATAMPQPPVFK